jgi:hypothetical protein
MNMTPESCVRNANCGYCHDSDACIRGTPTGPLEPCIKEAYRYTMASNAWSPLNASDINIQALDKNNQPLIVKAPTPDLSKIILSP